MKRLRVLCPQEYHGMTMVVTPCDKCSTGWDAEHNRCTVYIGVEHLPLVPADEVPICPIQQSCRHQLQEPTPCPVRARGLICESALTMAGDPNAADHPLSFNACLT